MKLTSGLPHFALLAGSIALVGSPASAVPTASVDIYENGTLIESLTHAQLGCGAPVGTVTTCQIVDHTVSTLNIDIGITLDEDPEIGTSLGIDNLSGATQHYTLVLTMLGVTIPGGTLMGGSNAWAFGDNTGDGVTLSTVSGDSLYTALIDGTFNGDGTVNSGGVATLFDDPDGGSDPSAFGGGTVGPASFGTPIPSALGPAVVGNIGIRYDFTLTGGDDASTTTGNFRVKPIPEPTAAVLIGLGLVALGVAGRRR